MHYDVPRRRFAQLFITVTCDKRGVLPVWKAGRVKEGYRHSRQYKRKVATLNVGPE